MGTSLPALKFKRLPVSVLKTLLGRAIHEGTPAFCYALTPKGWAARVVNAGPDVQVFILGMRREGEMLPVPFLTVTDAWQPEFPFHGEPTLSSLRQCLGLSSGVTPHQEIDFAERREQYLMAALALIHQKVVSPLLSDDAVITAAEGIMRDPAAAWTPLPRERFDQLYGEPHPDLPQDISYLRIESLPVPCQHPKEWLPFLVGVRMPGFKFVTFSRPGHDLQKYATLRELQLHIGVIRTTSGEEEKNFQTHRDEFYLAARILQVVGLPKVPLIRNEDGSYGAMILRTASDKVPGADVVAKMDHLFGRNHLVEEYGFRIQDRMTPRLRGEIDLMRDSSVQRLVVTIHSVADSVEPYRPSPRACAKTHDVHLTIEGIVLMLGGVSTAQCENLRGRTQVRLLDVRQEGDLFVIELDTRTDRLSLQEIVTLNALYCGVGAE